MMKYSTIFFCGIIMFFISCHNKENDTNQAQEDEDISELDECSCPPTIYLQPLNGFPRKKAFRIKNQLEKSGISLFDGVDIEVLPSIKLNSTTLNQTKTRYRADKILNGYLNKANKHYVIIGLLDEDISIPYKGRKDWGVLGLSYKGKYVSVVSTYRIKNVKRDCWKVVTHEFVHAYFNYGHCPKDNPNCIMQDAKGHCNFGDKFNLCKDCYNHL